MHKTRTCAARRRSDRTAMMGAAAILLAISILSGIAFTYSHRHEAVLGIDLNVRALDNPELPADL
jgi:hypothetical protein